MEAAIPGDPELPGNWPTCAALLPHAQAVLDLTSGGMWQIAQYLGYSGSYTAARDLFQSIADAFRDDDAHGAEHPDALNARASLARWTGQAGDAAAARDQLAALVQVRERVLGAEHPDTLADRADLARYTGEAGDAAGARDQYAALLPVRERVQGAEHRETLTTRASLAYFQAPREQALLRARETLFLVGAGQEAEEAAFAADADIRQFTRRMSADEAVARVPILQREKVAGALLDPGSADIEVDLAHQGFLRQARAWNLEELDRIQPEVLAADRACKTTGSPDHLIAERLALTIASRARRLGL